MLHQAPRPCSYSLSLQSALPVDQNTRTHRRNEQRRQTNDQDRFPAANFQPRFAQNRRRFLLSTPPQHNQPDFRRVLTGRIEEIHQRKGQNRRADKIPSSRWWLLQGQNRSRLSQLPLFRNCIAWIMSLVSTCSKAVFFSETQDQRWESFEFCSYRMSYHHDICRVQDNSLRRLL